MIYTKQSNACGRVDDWVSTDGAEAEMSTKDKLSPVRRWTV
jgi:hypothetical protein